MTSAVTPGTQEPLPPVEGPAPAPAWAAPFGAWVLRTRSEEGLDRLRSWAGQGDPVWVGQAARAEALWPDAGSVDGALAWFDRLPPDATSPELALLRAQVLLRAGADAAAGEVLTRVGVEGSGAWGVATDLANPHRSGSGADEEPWLTLFNEPFRRAGLEEVRLTAAPAGDDDPDPSPFRRLRATSGSTRSGDRVSVVVSTYRPGPDLLTSVRSLADQSWLDLEILLVDDASGPEADAWLERAEAMDPRVRILRQTENAGTYAARNRALQVATGRYVTFHDFDDWAHPQRVERQVDALRSARHAVASRSWCLRAYPDLSLTYPGYPPDRINASSLLYEREVVTDRIGGFHLMRKSADVEFPGRLRAAVRGGATDLPEGLPLAITQLRASSLSRTDAVPGWTRWSRLAYRDGYRAWHKAVAAGTSSPFVPLDASPGSRRRGSAPPTPGFSVYASPPSPERLDLVVLVDLHDRHNALRRLAVELASLAAAGVRVGIAHVEAPVEPRRKPGVVNRAIADLLNAGHLVWADPEAELEVGVLAVHTPPALLLGGARVPGWSVERVDLCVRNTLDLRTDVPAGSRDVRDVRRIEQTARRAWGRVPRWRALTASGRLALEEAGAEAPVVQQPLVVSPDVVGRYRVPSGRVRVGNGVLERRAPWEAPPADLIAAFPDDDRLDVRFAIGESAARQVLGAGSLPPNWIFFDELTGPHDIAFAGELDVVRYAGTVTDDVVESLREGVAAGAVVLLEERHRRAVVEADAELAALVEWVPRPPDVAGLLAAAEHVGLPARVDAARALFDTRLAGLAVAVGGSR